MRRVVDLIKRHARSLPPEVGLPIPSGQLRTQVWDLSFASTLPSP